MNRNTLPERFRVKIRPRKHPTMGRCWVWTAGCTRDGYGKVWHEGRAVGAHRAVYVILVGPIPPGMTLDHLCRRITCVRPSHMEIVTHEENVRRGNKERAR